MTLAQALVLLVLIQRLTELAWARRNARRLRAAGAHEVGAGHYPLFPLLHGAWLAVLWVLAARGAALDPVLASLYLLLQPARLWVIATLGERWTTRILVLPGAPLVHRGPYRYLRHPNYWIVAAEILLLPLALGAPWTALAFSLANGALLGHRVRVENRALLMAAAAPEGPSQRAGKVC